MQGLIWRANTYLLVEDQAQARDLCREAIALDPQHDGARLMLVRLLVNREPKEAQDHLQMLLRRDPGAPQLLYHQALIDRNLGRLAD
ncbi:MAG TPA: tetratricopeptide repeat protein, partial [Pirellulaceae bacterium]|nr:tetratricopeptide repeat protein [Pirellulaceae bacterium]